MKRTVLGPEFWDERYRTGVLGWDIGRASIPLTTYFDQLKNKQLKILIPGAGNAYEAEYLYNLGFTEIYVADISAYPLQNLKKRVPDFPEAHLLHQDFFELQQKFDLIIEQTFFCILNPEARSDYVKKAAKLLKTKGKWVGLLFTFPLNSFGPPPFGGNTQIYHDLFQEQFEIQLMESAYNSIPSRRNQELFCKMIKR